MTYNIYGIIGEDAHTRMRLTLIFFVFHVHVTLSYIIYI
jgi:hypothetical protein